ncbi:hypothetical protein DRO31_06600 [Candidatus Bathyarchaeota archaeon]|nr:MAG: hypothetical protein DRO31_06600 [Candidatus Bathyarchaeota archaeon]
MLSGCEKKTREKKICEWLLFLSNEAGSSAPNPWRIWSKLGAMGLNRRMVDSYPIQRGYNPFEKGAYVKFIEENFERIVEIAMDC